MTEAEPTKIPVKRLASALDFKSLNNSGMLHFAILSCGNAARAVAGEFESFLIDRTEVLADLDDDERANSDETAFAYVQRLEALGCVVLAGADHAQLRFDEDTTRTRSYPIGCIAIALAGDEPEFVTLDQGPPSAAASEE